MTSDPDENGAEAAEVAMRRVLHRQANRDHMAVGEVPRCGHQFPDGLFCLSEAVVWWEDPSSPRCEVHRA